MDFTYLYCIVLSIKCTELSLYSTVHSIDCTLLSLKAALYCWWNCLIFYLTSTVVRRRANFQYKSFLNKQKFDNFSSFKFFKKFVWKVSLQPLKHKQYEQNFELNKDYEYKRFSPDISSCVSRKKLALH